MGGGSGFPPEAGTLAAELVKRHDIPADRAAHLVDLYGTRAEEVLAFCKRRSDDRPLVEGCQVTTGEIAFLVQHEFALGLADVLLRRTPLSIRGIVSTELTCSAAAVLADELGWDEVKTTREVKTFTAELADYHGVSPEMLDQRDKRRS
ncbi:MAG: hypothetical protein DIU65_16175 [Proteobacteria bacterium]|nr:MAG: hypothetical protein DIU65_16175 [Pseudomonadota bacterium]